MTLKSEAIYEDGCLRLLSPMPLQPLQRVNVSVELPDVPIDAAERLARAKKLREKIPFTMGPKPTREEMNER